MHYEYPFDGIYDFGRPTSLKEEFSPAVLMDCACKVVLSVC